MMKAKEIRDLDAGAMGQKLVDYRKELFNLRFQHATAQLENTQRIKAVRRTIARIETIIQEKTGA
ncbi:LSU ribosomal protein L29P [Desulfocurvibacter africanus PCS]|jgi:large subunit ribosomal protein L29|uniref:Large ribosomal subunit protein uL29 n=3 Tax=Desulfocurvibacter africanus TaxID=873 RepID=F3YWN7_DESAF|nr:ribosomal protein L29 [Desulfocurvibacter africanus subsp. africanus str. Walvis Bay]EMG38240.1 LSU ribosomal protein L29P [Desulfocurvibacter africanus PCS]